MKGIYIPFQAFLSLILLTAFRSFNWATSVVPGWHSTIFHPTLSGAWFWPVFYFLQL